MEPLEYDPMNHDDAKSELLQRQRQSLSALVDGAGNAADTACLAWRDDASARADWRTYHLIGELMRSDGATLVPQREARLLARLRAQLANEPVVLAPAATPSRRRAWPLAWLAPMAVAAGFVAVAGLLVVTRVAAPEGMAQDRSALLANAVAAPAAGLQPVVAGAAAAPGSTVIEGTLIRDAELDRYLAAHKQYSSTSALAVPGGMVRSVAAAAPGR